MKLAAVLAVAVAAVLLILFLLQTSPGSTQPGHTQQAPPRSGTQTSTQPKGEKAGTQIPTQEAGEKVNTQTSTQPRSQTAVAPPGWRIVVEAGRYVEYPAKTYKWGEWREVFYLWNGTLYYEGNHTYMKIVGKVISYQPRNETVKKIVGTNPTQYILYNVMWYPLYSYQPQANTTPVKFRTYVGITRSRESYAYRVEGQLPASQIMWAVYLSFYNLTDRVPLNVKIQHVKINITKTDDVSFNNFSMLCIDTSCSWAPKIEIDEK
jgi:hypothetical protein